MLLCVLEPWDNLSAPGRHIPVPDLESQGVTVHFVALERGGRRVPTWFLSITDAAGTDLLERVFRHFITIHAQRECLKEVLRLVREERIKASRGNEVTDRLQDFFKLAVSWLTRQKRFGITRTSLLDTVYAADALVNVDQRDVVLGLLEEIRPNLLRQLKQTMTDTEEFDSLIASVKGAAIDTLHIEYIAGGATKVEEHGSFKMSVNNSTLTGVFGNGNRVIDSFQGVANSSADPEVKAALNDLLAKTTELAKGLPADQAAQVGRDLATFAEEAVAKAPRQELLNLVGNSLVGVAAMFVPFAKPVADLVGRVIGMVLN
jgi:hypothetical protein